MSEILSFPHEIEETTRAVQIHIYPQSGLYKRVQGGDVRLLHDDYNNVLGIEHLTIMPSRKKQTHPSSWSISFRRCRVARDFLE